MSGKLIDFRGDQLSPKSLAEKEQLEAKLTAIFKREVKVNYINLNPTVENDENDIR